MRMQASLMDNRTHILLGTVTSYNPTNATVICKIQPEDPGNPEFSLSGALPLSSQFVGNGWGMFSAPSIGDQVVIAFEDGNINSGMVIGRLWSNEDVALAVPSQEFWLVHKSGSYIKLTNDGKLSVNGNVEIDLTAPTINITANGNVTINADVDVKINAVNADIIATSQASITAPQISLGDGSASLKSLVNDTIIGIYNSHTHNDPQGGTTAIPNQLMSGADATSVVKSA